MARRCTLALAGLLAGCGFRPGAASDGAAGTEATGSGSDVHPGSDAGLDALDAFVSPDSPPGSCLDVWRTGTPFFKGVGSMHISHSNAVDRDPQLSPDELALYFSSNSGSVSNTTNYWRVRRTDTTKAFADGSEGLAADLDTNVNSASSEDKLTFTPTGHEIYFASSRDAAGNKLWHATSDGTQFGAPDQAHLAAVNATGQLADPSLSFDGQHLYFVTNDGGAQHIVVSALDPATGDFLAPLPVAGVDLDSGKGDADPVLSVDETVIVFSTQRAGVQGGTDLYYAVRASPEAPFAAAMPVPDVNTRGNDGDPALSHDGCTLIWATDTASTPFDYDLFSATLAPPPT